MKFERTDRFKGDWGRLTDDERAMFRESIRLFHAAAEAVVDDPSRPWPAGLRGKKVAGAPLVWEMTWKMRAGSFSGPNGRATFEWIRIGGAPAVRWRRIGSHRIFRDP